MKKFIVAGTNTLLACAKNLLDKGEITQEQYDKMVQRNEKISDALREDIIIKYDAKG